MTEQNQTFPLQHQVLTRQSKILSKKSDSKERTALLAIALPSGTTVINVILRGIEVTEDRDCIEEHIFKKIDRGQAKEREIGIARTPVKSHEKRFTIRPEDKRELLGIHFKNMKLEEVHLSKDYNED